MGLTDNKISEIRYMTDPQYAELRNRGVSYHEFSQNQNKYLSELGKTSIMDLFNKGKAMYEKYTNLYTEADSLFAQLNNEKTQKYKVYNTLLENYANQTGDVTGSQKSYAASKSGYTTDLINSVNNAETLADVYLDRRFDAVNMQRRGLLS